MKQHRKITALMMIAIFMISFIFPTGTALAAPAENYFLRGWDLDQEKWSPGNLSGYTELDWVPFRLEIVNYVGEETTICFQHDHEKEGILGYDDARNFFIGDMDGVELYDESDGVFSISGPEYIPGPGGVEEFEYCFQIDDPSVLSALGDDFALYWESQLAGPGQASLWPGASLHTTTSVTGEQTVPINIGKIEPLLSPDIDLSKTVDQSEANPGDTVTYTFAVTNSGDYDLSNVTVTDPMFGSGWSHLVGSLAVGETVSFEFDYLLPANTPAGTMINLATVNADSDGGDVDATDDETVTVMPINPGDPAISIEKTASVANAQPGDVISYSFHVSNIGGCDLSEVTVTDPLFGATWSHVIDTLHTGQIVMFDVSYTVPANTQPGTLVNVATVIGHCDEGNSSASDDASVVIDGITTGDPGVSIEKTAVNHTVNAGDSLTYIFQVTNTGAYPLTNVLVADPLFGDDWLHSIGNLAVGQTVTFQAPYTVSESALPGLLNNTATVTGSYGSVPVHASDSEVVTIAADPNPGDASIHVDKVASPQTIQPGGTVTYTVHVTNNGAYDLTNVVATDHLIGHDWSYPVGDLHIGETKAFTVDYLVPEGTPAGLLVNTINVAGSYTTGTVNGSDSEIVTIDAPDLVLSDLLLTSLCSDDPAAERRWKIRNNNHLDIPFTWELVGSGQSGSGLALADSDYFLNTATVSGSNILIIHYLNGREDSKISGGLQCSDDEMLPISVHSLCLGVAESAQIEWQLNNPNNYGVTAQWSVAGQSGTIVIPAGISSLYTDEVAGNPNTLTLTIDGEIHAVESSACFQDILLSALCSANPAERLRWRLTNSNDFAVEVQWNLLQSTPAQSGTITVPPGQISFFTNTQAGDNYLAILVDGVLQENGLVLNNKVKCSSDGNPPEDPLEEIIDPGDLAAPTLPGGEITEDELLEIELPEEANPASPSEQLPATGGGGQLIWYLAGLTLLAGGLVIRQLAARKMK